jgi:flagellar hook-associated protein 3
MQTIYQDALIGTRQISDQLTALQAQATTGQKFSKVSDDPTAALSVLTATDQQQRLSAHLDNIQTSTTTLNASVSALQQVSDLFSQAKSIAIEAGNSANDTTSFGAMADQVNGLINQLLSLANTQNNGTFLFGGSAAQTKPYAATLDAQGNAVAVKYQAATSGASAVVADGRQVELYYSGNEVFQPQSRQGAVFVGTTGAAAGTGTDSAVGRATLTVSHTSTSYAPGSGVQAGTSSAAGDTILGPAGSHTLTIVDTSGNGSAGTVSLDGGTAVAFTSADTDLRVSNAVGDVVYVDTTAITPNFNSNVAITSNGSLSIDGGATTTPITFSANQSVADANTGAVTWVDTTKIQRTGSALVSYPGTSDAFSALISLRDDLNNVNHLNGADQIKAISNDMSELDTASQQVLKAQGTQSAALQSLSSLQDQLQNLQLSTKETISNEGSADITDVVVKLQAYQQSLQLALMSFVQISSTNLLNYLK